MMRMRIMRTMMMMMKTRIMMMMRVMLWMMEINVPFNGGVTRRGNLSALLSVGQRESGKHKYLNRKYWKAQIYAH